MSADLDLAYPYAYGQTRGLVTTILEDIEAGYITDPAKYVERWRARLREIDEPLKAGDDE